MFLRRFAASSFGCLFFSQNPTIQFPTTSIFPSTLVLPFDLYWKDKAFFTIVLPKRQFNTFLNLPSSTPFLPHRTQFTSSNWTRMSSGSTMNQDPWPLDGLQFVQKPIDVKPGNGRVLVYEFWATWCGPCRSTAPHLSELAHKYPEIGVVGITSEPEAKVKGFLKQMGSAMSYSVAVDLDGQSDPYLQEGGGGIPHAFVVRFVVSNCSY
jgi:thiol-disulfide isomerase/thioredoxin